MKPFNELTENGRIRRIRTLAKEALTHYDLDVAKMSLLSDSFNIIFRLDTAGGEKFVLRVNYPNFREPIDIRSEMMWLDALSKETDVPVTTPFKTKDGRLFVTVATDGVPEPRHCAVFYWINGRIPNKPSLKTVQKVGTVMAKLHNHADSFNPAEPLSQTNYSETWQFGKPQRLFSDDPDPILTPERRTVLRATAKRVGTYLTSLYKNKDGLRFLHADLHLWNVKLHKGKIYVFDFDDSMNCFPVQDIGIALYYWERGGNDKAVREAFMRGYTAVRPSPETFPNEIDFTIAHRTLDLFSLLIRDYGDPATDGFLTNNLPRLKRWLEA